MSVQSYIAYPKDGKKKQLIEQLAAESRLEVYPADNEDVIVIVSTTSSEAETEQLETKINGLSELKMMTLVSAFAE